MGGGQANKGQAAQANQAAVQSENQSSALSNEEAREASQNYNYLFGASGPGGGGGSLSGMLDPKSLDVSSPTGAYGRAYNQATQQTAKDFANQKGTLAQSWANRGGAGMMPNGFQAEQERQLGRDEADQRGNLFTEAVGKQHDDALSNFWNANNIAAGAAATNTGAANQAAANEGSTATGIYGTAGQYHASPATAIIGAGLGAGGQVGAKAMCPTRGAKIRTKRGEVKVEELVRGDLIQQRRGNCSELKDDPMPETALCLRLTTQRGRTITVGMRHAFCLPRGGFVEAHESLMKEVQVSAVDRLDLITQIEAMGTMEVFPLSVGGDHTYVCDSFWSLD